MIGRKEFFILILVIGGAASAMSSGPADDGRLKAVPRTESRSIGMLRLGTALRNVSRRGG
jgi:hypothetical protein